MKKIRQQTLCMLLVPILCVFCFQFSAVAAGSNEVNISLIESLRNVEPNKADFGLENVDFEDFQISSPIKSYVYTAEGFEESYEYQPLLIDGQLTAFAIPAYLCKCFATFRMFIKHILKRVGRQLLQVY